MTGPTKQRVVFVAGATGAVGKSVLKLETQFGVSLVPHARAKSASTISHPNLVTSDLDSPQVLEAMRGCTTVMQLIGTMRHRFASGDTYETSDIGTTRTLVAQAQKAGIGHFILLTSGGAGTPVGAYLKAKAEAERIVRESGLPYTIFRPSAFADREGGGMNGLRAVSRFFGLHRLTPITLHELASALLKVARDGAPLGVALEGKPLWDCVSP